MTISLAELAAIVGVTEDSVRRAAVRILLANWRQAPARGTVPLSRPLPRREELMAAIQGAEGDSCDLAAISAFGAGELEDWRALAVAVNLSEDAAAGKAVGLLLQRYHAAADDMRTSLPLSCEGDRKLKLQWIIDQLGKAT